MDRNLWHLSHEGMDLEDPWNEPNYEMLKICTDPEKAPDKPTYIEIEFEKGVPVKVDGKAMKPADLVAYVNEVAAATAWASWIWSKTVW